jgi:hypothetical protein
MERTTILIPRTRKHPRKNRWLGKDTPFLPLTGTRLNAAHIKALPMKIATQYLQYQGGRISSQGKLRMNETAGSELMEQES